MARTQEITECRECGSAVLDRRAHRDWHDRVVVTHHRASGQRFVGVDVEEEQHG